MFPKRSTIKPACRRFCLLAMVHVASMAWLSSSAIAENISRDGLGEALEAARQLEEEKRYSDATAAYEAVAEAATEVEDWFFVYRAYDRGGHLNARIGEADKAIDLFNTAATLIRKAYPVDLSHPLTLRALTHLHINLVGQYWNQGKIALAWSAHLESGGFLRSVLRSFALTENPDLYEVEDYKIIPPDQRIQDRFYANIILNEIRFRVEMGRPREALALSRALVLRLQRWSEKNRIDENKLVKAHITVAWVLRYLGYEKEAIDKKREALTVYGTRRDSSYYFEFAQYNHDPCALPRVFRQLSPEYGERT